ncbi:hypothetical protein QM565_37950, partial [Geitlerinema splendidum]|nr:hypothetical protein [Geitlerinema splendidum]
MKNFRNSLLVLSLFACIAGTSFADNSADLVAQAAGPRQGQQGGPGGSGGMQMRRMGPPMVILMDQKVQEHLKLTPQQIERLRTELAPPPGGPGGPGGPQGG